MTPYMFWEYPTIDALKDDDIKNSSIEDLLANNGNRWKLTYQEFLKLLSERLQGHCKTMPMYGLPETVQRF